MTAHSAMPCSITNGLQEPSFYELDPPAPTPSPMTVILGMSHDDAVEQISDALHDRAPVGKGSYLDEMLNTFRNAGGARNLMERRVHLEKFVALFESCLDSAGDSEYAEQLYRREVGQS